jgi:hypothetical protein
LVRVGALELVVVRVSVLELLVDLDREVRTDPSNLFRDQLEETVSRFLDDFEVVLVDVRFLDDQVVRKRRSDELEVELRFGVRGVRGLLWIG